MEFVCCKNYTNDISDINLSKMDISDKMSVKKAMELSLDEYIAESGLYDSSFSKKRRVNQNKNSDINMCDQVGEVKGVSCDNESDLTVNQQQNHTKYNFEESSKQRCSTLRNNGVNHPAVTQSLSMKNPFRSLYHRQRNNYRRNGRNKNKKMNRKNNKYNSNVFEQQHERNDVYMQNRDNNYNNVTFQPSLSNVSRSLHMLPNDITATDLNGQAVTIPNITVTNNQRNQSFIRPLQYFSGINNQYDLMNDSNTNLQTTMLANSCGNINTEIMPYLTAKFLEFVNSNKSKYDIRIQKEIHSIQGKRMVYRCSGSGGEIISSDGPGLNCILQPAVTGLTLNQRFA